MLADDDFSDDLMSLAFLPAGAHRANSDQRDAIVVKTIGIMRRRRMAKRIGLAAALAGCYAAGLLTMSLIRELNSSPNLATAITPLAPGSAGGPESPKTHPPQPISASRTSPRQNSLPTTACVNSATGNCRTKPTSPAPFAPTAGLYKSPRTTNGPCRWTTIAGC